MNRADPMIHPRLFLSVLLVALLGLATTAHAGSVRYPALGNFEVEEGTLELWLTPTVELYPEVKEGGYSGILSLFSLEVPGEFSMGASWYAKHTRNGAQHRLHISMGHKQHRRGLLPVPAGPVEWQRGQMQHLAFTWRGGEMTLYANGERVGHRSQPQRFTGRLADCDLIIGNPHGRDAGYILHAVRISRTAHDAEMQKDAEPVARMDTLLLDRLNGESLDTDQAPPQTRAEVIGGLVGETGGTVHGTYHVVGSPEPGIALNQKETE